MQPKHQRATDCLNIPSQSYMFHLRLLIHPPSEDTTGRGDIFPAVRSHQKVVEMLVVHLDQATEDERQQTIDVRARLQRSCLFEVVISHFSS